MEIDLKTEQFTIEEQKKIVQMVIDDYGAGIKALQDYFTQRRKDIQMYAGEKPSIIEGLKKKEWQSDRNLMLCAAVCDMLQAVLLATVWNPDTIRPVPTEKNDINNADNISTFLKWAVGKNESDVFDDIDSFIHNRITQGFSALKVRWEVKHSWVDRRIPKRFLGRVIGYNLKTELFRRERGIIENIDNVEDIICLDYGKSLQDVPFLIHVLHQYGNDVLDRGGKNIYTNVNEEFVEKLKGAVLEWKRKQVSKEKANQLHISDIDNMDLRVFPIDIYEWYGEYEKDGKKEEYRFHIEPITRTFLSGKPLRKVTRTGRRPFIGGGFIKIPGHIRGKSLPALIQDITNSINNVYNQKADFQTQTNLFFGFYNADLEGQIPQTYNIEPGNMYPLQATPVKDNVYFPNLQRSIAWADNDVRFLLEVLERLTGAASYFLTYARNTSGTATRDMIINQKSETRFSLWVKRLMGDIAEALTLYFNMYQDWAPKDLGERVLGKDGKQLIKNLSIETLRGGYNIQMSPDIISGSRALESQLQMWALEAFQNCVWTNPQVNPSGNWQMWADALRKVGRETDVEKYLGPKPKAPFGMDKDIEDEWVRFMQGEEIDPPEGATSFALQHLMGHLRQKEERYHELDKEYRANFDKHLFRTMVNVQQFFREVEAERMANVMAMDAIHQGGAQQRQPMPQPQPQPQSQPQPQLEQPLMQGETPEGNVA